MIRAGFLVRACIEPEPQAPTIGEVHRYRRWWVERCVGRALNIGWVFGLVTGIALAVVREGILSIGR